MPVVKVTKDGSVTQDGTVIGRVEKREQPAGPLETAMGFSLTSGKVLWFGFAADGTQLTQYGEDTRKAAVRRVELHAQPLAVNDMKLEYGLGSDVQCIVASVTWQGHYCGVSRYPHESAWIVDSLFMPGTMMPVFSNGTGTRVTTARALKGEQEAAATAEAVRLGLLPVDATS